MIHFRIISYIKFYYLQKKKRKFKTITKKNAIKSTNFKNIYNLIVM